MEFTYTNLVPPAGRPGTNTNLIRLWRDDSGLIHYDRRYVSDKDKSVSDPIEHTFGAQASPAEITAMIHWGCCGWSAGLHQMPTLWETVKSFCGFGPEEPND